jgi:hypothetical protein
VGLQLVAQDPERFEDPDESEEEEDEDEEEDPRGNNVPHLTRPEQ